MNIQETLIPISKYTRPGEKLKAVKGIVIHWTANERPGADADAHYRYFRGSTRYASAHYFVDSTGILRIIPEDEMAYHVGARSYKTDRFGTYPNNSTIGVEMCVNSDGDFNVTYENSVKLVAHLLKKYGLGLDDLVRHYDVTGKSCPKMFTEDIYGRKYMGRSAKESYAKFRADVERELKGSAPTPNVDTSKGIGILEVIVPNLNLRQGNSFSSPVERVMHSGEKYIVFEEKNGMYRLSKTCWTTANEKYVRFTPHPKPEPKPEPKAEPKVEGIYRVQAGAFGTRENAEALVNRLKAEGFDAYVDFEPKK